MLEIIRKNKSKLVFKITVFFIVGVLLPLTLILFFSLSTVNNRNTAETENFAYNTILNIEKSFRNELYNFDSVLDSIVRNQYVTEYPFKNANVEFNTESHNFVNDFSVNENAVFDSLKFYYYQLDFWAEDETFLSSGHVSDEKWYIDYFAENGYTSWRIDSSKDSLYRVVRLYNGSDEVGVAVAKVSLERVIEAVGTGITNSTDVFVFPSYSFENCYVASGTDKDNIISLINKAGFSRNDTFDSEYRVSVHNDSAIAINNIRQFGVTVGCRIDIVTKSAHTPTYLIIIFVFMVFLGAAIIVYYFIFRIFGKLNRDIKLMESYIENDFTGRIAIGGNDEIAEIEKQFNRMLDRLDTLKNNIILKEQSQKHAELTALQNQTNPHFIYNTLNTFRMKLVISGDMQTAEEIAKFGKLLRYNMTTRDHMTTLDEEMTYLKYYLDLQNDRFTEKIFYDYQVPLGFGNIKLPRFIFQPMAENSLKYGKKQGSSLKITVSFEIIDGDYLMVSFMDNGKGCDERTVKSLNTQFVDRHYIHRPNTENSSKIGLKNINERLILIYGEEYHLTVSSEEGKYFEIGFKIPIKDK